MLLANRKFKVRKIMQSLGISQSSVVSILNDLLCMIKLYTRWVPRLLTIGHKRNRIKSSRDWWGCSIAIRTNFVPMHNRGRKMDSPQYFQDQHWLSLGEKAQEGLATNEVTVQRSTCM